ncbi:MAG: cation:proton antiporter [Geminicoccaceae bacterium]
MLIGGLVLLGLVADVVGRLTHMPRITMLVIIGILVGDGGFDLLPDEASAIFPLASDIALLMIAFLLGGQLTVDRLRETGRPVIAISLCIAILSAVLTTAGLWLAGMSLVLALVLGGIAPATDPAAVSLVVKERGADTRFGSILLGAVAIDDAWGLLVFALMVSLASASTGGLDPSLLLHAGREIGLALLIGVAIGLPAAWLTGRIEKGEPLQSEALGIVFICGGLATWLGASFLLAAMTTGAMVANFARHHERAFHEIENIEWPFVVLFFVLSGATLDPHALVDAGPLLAFFIIFRIVSRLIGGRLGARIAEEPEATGRWIGIAMMPQAGVALGMALVAAQRFPEHGGEIMAVAIGATVIFEVIGPVLTRLAIDKATA